VGGDWSLLDRLASPKRGASAGGTGAGSSQVRSILRHLQKLLNSRQGHAPAQMDYGIPDPGEVAHNYSDAIGQIQKSIKACVEKYEPRLTAVNVTHVVADNDVLTLRFQITGQVANTKERIPVLFDTLIDPSGRIKLKD